MEKHAAVIGSGVMGHGIAQLYALAGFRVFLYDLQEAFLMKARASIEHSLSLQVAEGVIADQSRVTALEHIVLTTDLRAAVSDAEIITEAVPEVIELKWELFEKLEQYARPDAIIASNTSTFSIARLIEKATTPQRFIITHFFNPAQLVPLVEVVRHESTAQEVVHKTMQLMEEIGKSPVLLKKDVPGFIANRLQTALMREAFHLLAEGVADAAQIDTVMKDGIGYRWAFVGPIETMDFGGLDTWKRVMDNLAPELDASTKAPAIIEERVAEGNLGTKTGAGIYSYMDTSVSEKLRVRDEQFIRLGKMNRG
ncbi:3-hydroxyacyl-CoA dehydrogenase family protein [Brevibacillus porteri]|uniref:3-hydroxybutyryl-CoA dehydrogenase n=1 Tax=Brevibacillus porteri TaxID=2126350 RepID=A0ABX5FH19_9BACL|nr:3-hydroxyacyl-CoA dehydrogenase family protein [Brevibacillus porteri]MED1797480.1 3-hydroxyacyl-CoA dehydrogenase family protein [Brevibacillus porteri]MED2130780.1 3-hydroxyacyl-CoA dehydrogenase family protein [Brevibacillus porteri]MED2744959.1 3-hydroxyacyl-CoA dehydrogenase family protein [Brevibacillus porteri]MED2815947.1 3-hydroxyacyl-CoA dehydrogenase family protein [Brevibacillus porteri]MED2895006.1 3-hydroxyacyl-CoA dehydrogenase family protein [Brevibacillus porteri]